MVGDKRELNFLKMGKNRERNKVGGGGVPWPWTRSPKTMVTFKLELALC